MKQNIIPILMPKWGLTMEEGQVNEWLVREGAEISVGDEIIEVETDKISGTVEAVDAGVLRRCIAENENIYPVKSLLSQSGIMIRLFFVSINLFMVLKVRFRRSLM
mgnify:CR=1 FL=1